MFFIAFFRPIDDDWNNETFLWLVIVYDICEINYVYL